MVPEPIDPIQLVARCKKVAKAKRIIPGSMKDHFVSHIAEKITDKDMSRFI
jgi:hypothetical protein